VCCSAIRLDLRKLAEPDSQDLAETNRETAHMVILDMGEVVYIDKTEAPQATGSLKMVSAVGLTEILSTAVASVRF